MSLEYNSRAWFSTSERTNLNEHVVSENAFFSPQFKCTNFLAIPHDVLWYQDNFKANRINYLTVICKWQLLSKDLSGGWLNSQSNGHKWP